MTSREKRALAAAGKNPARVEAEKRLEGDCCQLDFRGRILTVKDGQVRVDLSGLPDELKLAYHTVAAMFLARDGVLPRGKVKVPWIELDRFMKETIDLAIDGNVKEMLPDGSIRTITMEE